jgi:uncharacterized protein YlxW (UPF0749 family)
VLVLGLLLILGSAALGVGLVYDGSEPATVEVFGFTANHMTTASVFFSGAATMLMFLLGVWLLTLKMGRSRRKRVERKETRRRQRDSVAGLEQERTQLAAENERLSEKLDTRQDTTVDAGENTGVHARQDDSVDIRQDTNSSAT